jgi:hypothetical protein
MRCLKIMGEKPPYEDTSITHGLCDKCLEIYKKEAEAAHKQGDIK